MWLTLRDDGCFYPMDRVWVWKFLKAHYADAYICRKCIDMCNHINILYYVVVIVYFILFYLS